MAQKKNRVKFSFSQNLTQASLVFADLETKDFSGNRLNKKV